MIRGDKVKDKKKGVTVDPIKQKESALLTKIMNQQQNAESVRGTSTSNDRDKYTKTGIEQIWEDEYKMFKGDHWSTSVAYRSREGKKNRPNSVDNFIFPAIMNIHANIIGNTPEPRIQGIEDQDEDVAKKLTFISIFNDIRNKFKSLWKRMVLDYIAYGPIIGGVFWDSEWMGGYGERRWVGDVKIDRIDRKNIFFDPAIIDLEGRLQGCEFINRKFRKKVAALETKYPDKVIMPENNGEPLQNEGAEPNQVWLIESWHKGVPEFLTDKQKQEFNDKADQAEADGDTYMAQDYRDMASGTFIGVHVAYVANQTFLEYIPYIYEDGKYPFVYRSLYQDENAQFGFGEIRNIMVPQIMHNKADEIEIEAMSRQGLGGSYHKVGALTPKQQEAYKQNSGKGGMLIEVNDLNGIKDREGVKVPASIVDYKEHKQRMVETISQNTPIQQGISPGANTPFRAIVELGARTDIRTKAKVETLEDFLTELNQLRISRFTQFYTEDRYYRIKGSDGKTEDGTFNRNEMMRSWDRESNTDEMGNPSVKQEKFIPEFDVEVKILDEKPTDRNYYTSTAFEMFKLKGMTMADLWYTLEEGKFPSKANVLENLKEQDASLQIMDMLANVPQEQKDAVMQQIQQLVQQTSQSNTIDQFVQTLPDEILQQLQSLPQDQQDAYIQQLMQQQPQK